MMSHLFIFECAAISGVATMIILFAAIFAFSSYREDRQMNHTPNPIDTLVGQRLKTARLSAGLSLEKLANVVDVTFQQIQKYEKGTNRISASRLVAFAQILKQPISYFFEGCDVPQAAAQEPIALMLSTREGMRLAEAFLRMERPTTRRAFVEFAEIMATSDEEEFDEAPKRVGPVLATN